MLAFARRGARPSPDGDGALQTRSRGWTEEGPGPTWETGVGVTASVQVGGDGDGACEGGLGLFCVLQLQEQIPTNAVAVNNANLSNSSGSPKCVSLR